MRAIVVFLTFICLFAACGGGDKRPDDREIARVYDKTLYASELAGSLSTGLSPQDSALLTSAFVQRWISDQLLMYEAERNIPKDANIDQLVRDYRASLVRFNYEEQLISQQLDSTVSESELRAFYEQNKEQFQLQSTIIKCVLVKLPQSAPTSEMNKLWNSRSENDQAKLAEFARQWAALSMLDQEKWYRLEDIAAILKDGTLTDDGFRFYYRILETVRGKETAPFDYARDQAVKMILHRRKKDLLDNWKRNLYDNELRRGNIKVF